MNPQLQTMLQQAIEAFQGGNFGSADSILKRVIAIDSRCLPALHILGLIKVSQSKFSEAAKLLGKAALLNPEDASIQYNLAKALVDSGAINESMPHHKKAVQLAPNNPEAWLNYGNAMSNLKRYSEALEFFDKALSLNVNYPEAFLNKGATLKELKRYEEALACYDKALSINTEFYEGWLKKGIALLELKRSEDSITSYDKALSLRPNCYEAWIGKAAALDSLNQFEDAITHAEQGLRLNSDIDWAYGNLVHTKQKICQLSGLDKYLTEMTKKILAGDKVSNPFPLLSLSDNSFLHKQCAEIYAKEKYPPNNCLEPIPKHPERKKIRIGYFSPDFKNHPVSILIAELIEIHDRDRFEIIAFSLRSAPRDDVVAARLRNGFDSFLDVETMSDIEVAKLAREQSIDIAVDLSGFTLDSRTGIFSYQAAPIQVNWLGYPGTFGAGFIDYIISDYAIIPESHQSHYIEKIAYLPHTYMVDDSKRVASERIFTRQEFGLPEDKFVYCCFNNGYKFNEQILDSWSTILENAKNSILWVSENNEVFQKNITAEFENRGIDKSRIIFLKKIDSMADHLARYALADLFLDTFPYNAHTTALDSLKAGVPVLACPGNSFASRVTASLLTAIGIPELISKNQTEYETLAIEMASNPEKLAAIKQKLANNRLSAPLFNTPLFARHLEAAYSSMMKRYWDDLPPAHIHIKP